MIAESKDASFLKIYSLHNQILKHIEDVLASGVIGDETDGCRVRGAVEVQLVISRCFGICNNCNKLLLLLLNTSIHPCTILTRSTLA